MVQYYQLGASWELGLPFNEVRTDHIISSNNQTIVPTLYISEATNINYTSGTWTCQRRNNISLDVSFSLSTHDVTSDLRIESLDKSIQCFAISLSTCTKLVSKREPIKLIQMSSDRRKDKTASVPTVPITPTMKFRNPNIPYEDIGPAFKECDIIPNAETLYRPYQYRFSRVQFSNATRTGKKCGNEPTVNLSVDLYADISNPEDLYPVWVKVHSRVSSPIVVIGRSPCYDERKRLKRLSSESNTTVLPILA